MEKRNIAIFCIYDFNKKILFQHRSKNAPTLPSNWGFFGGKIEQGETPRQAVIRECFEELKYNLIKPKLIIVHNFIYKQYDFTYYIFVEQYNPDKDLILCEGQNLNWFNLPELNKTNMIDEDKYVAKAIYDRLFISVN
mgnify:CR=1 FL=1|jgi:8-oxo-dGTP diphosphatase